MSACISREGEYSGHTIPCEPDAFPLWQWTCSRCFVLDEDALGEWVKKASERIRHDHAYPMEFGPHHCPGCDLEAEATRVLPPALGDSNE